MPAIFNSVASFRIFGHGFEPDSFLTEVQARRCSPGENNGVGVWSIALESNESEDFDEYLVPLLSRLEEEKLTVRSLLEEENVQAQVFVSIFSIFPTDAIASARINLHPETLRRIAELGASIVMDFYAREDDEEDD